MLRSPRIIRLALIASLAAMAQGCLMTRSGPPRATKAASGSADFSREAVAGRINADELDRLTNGYADQFRTRIEDAVGELVRGNPSAQERAVAMRMLVESTSSVYDIATSGDPAMQVLDLTVAVTLMSQVWIDQNRAQREFKEADPARLIQALRATREEIWEIASRVYSHDQLLALDFLITNWTKRHPGVEDVYWVRFSDFGGSSRASLVADIAGGGEYYDPIGRAMDQAKSYERLTERMFYLAKRGATLAGWQSQAVVEEVLAKPEVSRALGNVDTLSRSVDELTKSTTRLTAEIPELLAREREAVFAELDRRQKAIDASLASVKGVLDSAAPIVRDVNTLAETSERMIGKVAEIKGPVDPDAPPGKPFDPDDYTRLLAQASGTIRDASDLAGSPAIKTILDDVNRATDERIRRAEDAVVRVVWLAGGVSAGLIALLFAGAVAYRRMGRSAA